MSQTSYTKGSVNPAFVHLRIFHILVLRFPLLQCDMPRMYIHTARTYTPRTRTHTRRLKQDSSTLSISQKPKSKSHNNSRLSSSSSSTPKPSSSVGGSSDSTSKHLHPNSSSKGTHHRGGSGFSDARPLGDRDNERGSSGRRHHPCGSTKHDSRSRSGSKSPRSRYSSREKTPSRSSR